MMTAALPRGLRLITLAAFLLALVPVPAADQRLVLTGSSTVAPLAAEIGKRFEARHPGVRVDVQTGGSSRGIQDVRNGLADIGMVSRALKDSERDLQAHSIALDGISVIVHRDNPVSTLSDPQIAAVFTGRLSNWRDLGGPDRRITVVNKAEGRSTLELFLAHFGLKNSDIEAHVVIGDNQQGIKTVAGNPGAIGYVSIGSAESQAALGTPIKLLPVTGVSASAENVRAARHPLARTLNLVTLGEPGGIAARFIEFARSAEVHDLVEAEHFAPLAH